MMMDTFKRDVPLEAQHIEFHNGQIDAMLVPFDSSALVADPLPDGSWDVYKEGFKRTAFDDQIARPGGAANALFKPHHEAPPFGWVRRLVAGDDGLYGTIQVWDSHRSDVQDMVSSGIDQMSIEFRTLQRNPRHNGDTRWRDKVELTGVALTGIPAYGETKVLAMRAGIVPATPHLDALDLSDLYDTKWTNRDR